MSSTQNLKNTSSLKSLAVRAKHRLSGFIKQRSTAVARVGYLNALPGELWETILFEAAMSEEGWIFLPSPGEAMYIRGSSGVMQFKRAQARRLTLCWSLCKAFLPIMEAILFSHVIITSNVQFRIFIGRASAPRSSGPSRGHWTASFIYERHGGENDELLADTLYQLSKFCPRLCQLRLRNLWKKLPIGPYSLLGPFMFPRLRCLILPSVASSTAILGLNMEAAALPVLQYLHLTSPPAISRLYLEQFGWKLTTLELSHGRNGVWTPSVRSPVPFPENLFQLCPRLQCLGFPFEEFLMSQRVGRFSSFQPLTSLVLHATPGGVYPDCLLPSEGMQIQSNFFNEYNFPNVSQAVVLLDPVNDDPKVKAIVDGMFPGARVDILPIGSWYTP